MLLPSLFFTMSRTMVRISWILSVSLSTSSRSASFRLFSATSLDSLARSFLPLRLDTCVLTFCLPPFWCDTQPCPCNVGFHGAPRAPYGLHGQGSVSTLASTLLTRVGDLGCACLAHALSPECVVLFPVLDLFTRHVTCPCCVCSCRLVVVPSLLRLPWQGTVLGRHT